MTQKELDLKKTIKLFNKMQKKYYSGYNFSEFSACYRQSNERLKALFSQIDFSNKNTGLTVLGSGDQLLNMLYKGISSIDTFDCNRLTEYYVMGFKMIAIQCLKMDEFIELFKNKENDINNVEIQKYVISCAPDRYKDFWINYMQYLDDYKNGHKGIFEICRLDFNDLVGNNLYLQNEFCFKEMKQKIMNASVSFRALDIKDIPQTFKVYDFIYLSNILEYRSEVFGKNATVTNVARLVENIYNNNLNNNGELIYLYTIQNYFKDLHAEIALVDKSIYYADYRCALSLKK